MKFISILSILFFLSHTVNS